MESLWSPSTTPWPSNVTLPGSGSVPTREEIERINPNMGWDEFLSRYGLDQIGTPPIVPEQESSSVLKDFIFGDWWKGNPILNPIGKLGELALGTGDSDSWSNWFSDIFQRLGLGVLGIAVVIIALVMLTRPTVQRVINQVGG
jgi:hypothetical protein